MKVAAIILAAGGGSRFGGAKQLALVGGVPLVGRAVQAASAAKALDPVIVVTGARADEVAAVIRGATPSQAKTPDGATAEQRVRVVRCAAWAEGLGASLRAGIRAAGPVDAALVLLADQPLVDGELVQRVLDEGLPALAGGAADAARPFGNDGRPGHPVLLGRAVLERADQLHGDRGLAGLLDPARLHGIEVDGEAAFVDVDRPADLAEAEAALRGYDRVHPAGTGPRGAA